jgi:hypothetical protein
MTKTRFVRREFVGLFCDHKAREKFSYGANQMSKLKKIEKEFVITDNTVNSYGFRLLTEGYLIAEYKKNPIGYAMHKREDGVLVKWEDLRVDGDKVYAKPVINLSHAMGQRTVDEIENGFLNAASVGHIVVLETSEEADLKLDGQTGPTVTKWFNRECSLVDVPGNFNALQKLFDADEKPLSLADFSKPKLLTEMKKIEITAAMLMALNLKAESNDQEFATAFNDLVAKAAKADELKTELTSLKAEVVANKVKAEKDRGIASKKLTVELADKLAKDYATNPEGLKAVIDAMPEIKSVTEHIEKTSTISEQRVKDLVAKGFDGLMDSGEMAELKGKAPEAYKQLYKDTFGTEPKV